jgi:hypothetical protein
MRISILIALSFLVNITNAQLVSLNNAEIENLRKFINTNKEVNKLFIGYQKIADQALDTLPNPIAVFSTEGRLTGDPIKTASNMAIKDMRKMYALAIVYRINVDEKYLRKAIIYLLAWATLNHSKGDPIDDTSLEQAIESYDLLKSFISLKDKKIIEKWLKQIAEAELESLAKKAKMESTINNWNSHRLKIMGLIAYAINDIDLQSFVISGIQKQIAINLYADGSGIDFKLRDALHYHVYNLEPLLRLSILLKRATNSDYYNYVSATNSSIRKSVEWLLPYLTGEKTHAEFVHSTVAFDAARGKNNEADYIPGSLFKPVNGIKTLTLAAYFNSNFSDTVKLITNSTVTFSSWQLVLNKIME